MSYYEDDTIRLFHGDALDVLRGLPDGSVDAVVTDPPYGLEFMGKDWDGADGFRRSLNPADVGRDSAFGRLSAKAPEYRTASKATAGMSGTGYTDGANRIDRPSSLGGLNPKCVVCGRWQRGANPCKCSEPQWTQERLVRLHTFQEWCEVWATECLRVLKPGGYLLAFGGSRTWHRLACAIEDAGFEVRDSIAWLYGSGFPKSLDVSKAIDKAAGAARVPVLVPTKPGNLPEQAGPIALGATGMTDLSEPVTDAARKWQGWGTALKPAFEPIVMARKPLIGTVAANVIAHGTGALNIDAARIGLREARDLNRNGSIGYGGSEPQGAVIDGGIGRWPTNVALDASAADDLDRQTGVSESRIGKPRGAASGDGWGMTATAAEYDDAGGASRFFPVFRYEAKAPTEERPNVGGIAHPTVKPLDLMRWLVRLVTPPGGTVLEPFAGSGTTVEACIHEGFGCIAIEREATYLPLIQRRIDRAYLMANHAFDFEEPA